MNIMIAGCGKVGKSIAMRLCEEGHQVTVIDKDEVALHSVTGSLDVIGYRGDCTSIEILKEAVRVVVEDDPGIQESIRIEEPFNFLH